MTSKTGLFTLVAPDGKRTHKVVILLENLWTWGHSNPALAARSKSLRNKRTSDFFKIYAKEHTGLETEYLAPLELLNWKIKKSVTNDTVGK